MMEDYVDTFKEKRMRWEAVPEEIPATTEQQKEIVASQVNKAHASSRVLVTGGTGFVGMKVG